MSTHQILRLPQVLEITQLSRSTLYTLAKKGEFPRPLKLGARASGWIESDICAWIESRRTFSNSQQ